MRSIRFVCFALFISALVLAQANRDQIVNQRNGPHIVQQRHSAVLANHSQRPQGARLAQRETRAFKATAPRRGASPMQGLDFAPAVAYDSGGWEGFSVAVADVNGDGKPDLVVANLCADSGCIGTGTLGVLLGNGDGTFQTAVAYGSGGHGAVSVAAADVNGDSKPDLVVANCGLATGCGNGNVGVLLGNGDGTFQTAVTFGSGEGSPMSVAIADVNSDGKPDLLVANSTGSIDGHDTVGVLLGNGDGTFQTAVTYYSGGYVAYSVAVADVNGDSKPDILVTNSEIDRVGVLLGNGDGTFQTAVTYYSGGYTPFSVAIADVNGDSKPDLVVANCGLTDCVLGENGTVGVLLGNGDGTFQTALTYDSGGYISYWVAAADVNGDSKPDLVVANCGLTTECGNGGAVGVLLGNGDGTFQTAVAYGSGGSDAVSVAVADVNGDSKPDLVVANPCSSTSCNNGSVGVLINLSIGSTKTTLASAPNPSTFGQAVTFTATVTGRGFYNGPPTGTVSFFDGTTNIGISPLDGSGVAILTTSTLTVGTHNMTAIYNGDANFAPSTSPVLYQVVQGAIVVLSPTSLNFGDEAVGITSPSQFTMLTNTGNIVVAISSIQVTGANSGDFAEKNNCGSSLSPKAHCKIHVTFTPTATGTRIAAVSITDNAPDSPQTVALIGVGVLPAVTFSPKSLTFPTQLIFTTSPAQPVQLTNSGLGTLIIRKIVVGREFVQTNDCPMSIAPGASCTIDVKFHPKNKGLLKAALSVIDNALDSPQKVPLTGTGTFVQLIPTKVNFGTQPVGTRSLAKKITLTNKGSATVKISSIAITGTDAGDFVETNTCGKSVAAGASCFIKVTFKPLVKGKRTADVSVYDNGGASPQKVPLSGTGT